MVLSLEFVEVDSEVVGCERTSKVILNKNDLGPGILTIAHNSISWCSSNPEQELISGLNFTYTDIILFAVSKDAAVYESECLFVLLDKQKKEICQDSGIGDVINRLANGHLNELGNGNENGEEDDENDDEGDDEEENSEELYIVLENVDKLKSVYDMLVQCQNLHPDPNQGDFDNWNDSDNENNDDDDDDEFDSGYANNEGSNNNGIDEHPHENGNGNNADDYEELIEDDDGMAVDDDDQDDNDSLYEDAD